MDRNLKLYPLYRILTLEGMSHGIYLLWLVSNRHFAPALVATWMSVGAMVIFAMQLPTGWLADRYGRRTSLLLGSFLQVMGMAALWQARNPWLAATGFIVIGIGDAARSGAQEALLYESRPHEFASRLARSQVLLLAALALETSVGGLLAARWGGDVPWACDVCLSTLGLVTALCMLEPPRTGTASGPVGRLSIPRRIWRPLWVGALVLGCGSLAGFLTPLALSVWGPAWVAAAVGVLPLAEAVGSALAARIPASRHTLALCVMVAGLGMVIPGGFILVYGAVGVAVVVRMQLVFAETSDHDRARLGSLGGLMDLAVNAISLPAIGYVYGAGGLGMARWAVALTVLLLGIAGSGAAP